MNRWMFLVEIMFIQSSLIDPFFERVRHQKNKSSVTRRTTTFSNTILQIPTGVQNNSCKIKTVSSCVKSKFQSGHNYLFIYGRIKK